MTQEERREIKDLIKEAIAESNAAQRPSRTSHKDTATINLTCKIDSLTLDDNHRFTNEEAIAISHQLDRIVNKSLEVMKSIIADYLSRQGIETVKFEAHKSTK